MSHINNTEGTVVLGYGPQSMDWIGKASKLAGKEAVMDPDVARMAGANLAAGPRAALDRLRSLLEAGALAQAKATNPGLSEAASRWLANGERGISSNAMFSHLTGIDATGMWGFDPPSDPADFRRCQLLLEQVPELQPLLPQMKSVSPAWLCLVDDWAQIVDVMDGEAPGWRTSKGQKAPHAYALIKSATGR